MGSDEKNIGRRTFIGLMLAGIVALLVGKDLFHFLNNGRSSSGSTGSFRINTVKQGPPFDPATWRLTMGGLVRENLEFTYAQFTDLPATDIVRDFYCVEGWGVAGCGWKGVRVKDLVQRAGVLPQATHLLFHSGDGVYTDSLTIEQSQLDDVLLVYELNGAPLTPDMGQPVRLIFPGHYGYKYVKWVEQVEAVDYKQTPFIGYWEQYGYSVDATIPSAVR
jgi:methionine sulfoxide reductase catalytic subunit